VKYNQLPINKGIIPPKEGWKGRTYYKVLVSFNSDNPAHYAIFYTGFLAKGNPCGYNQLWNPTWDSVYKITEMYALEVICELFGEEKKDDH